MASGKRDRPLKEAPTATPARAKDASSGPSLRALFLKPREPLLVPFVLAIAVRVFYSVTIPFASEDAYITFRFAENWAHGLGPVYNAGERVLGFSSPLWTAWLALGSLFIGPVAAWARISGIVLDLVALVVATRFLLREHGRVSAWAFALFFALIPIFAANAVLGMETSLFLCLLFVAAERVSLRRKDAGVWLGLLAITRPEAFLCALLLALRADGRARVIALGIAGSAMVALGAYFGSPIPQSVLAKAATYGLGGPLNGGAWVEGLVPVFVSGRWPVTGEGTNLFPFAIVAFPAVLVAWKHLWDARRRRDPVALTVLAGLAVLAGYTLTGVPYFSWYAVMPFAAWGMAAAVGLPLIVRHKALYLGLLLYLVSDSWLLRHLYVERVRQEAISFWQTGLELKRISGGHGTVLLEPLGHIGYISGLTVYDEVGLVSPLVARRRAGGPGWYTDVVARLHPDYLVVRDGFFDKDKNESFAGPAAPFRDAAESAAVLDRYEVVPMNVKGQPTGLTLLRRRT
jgi:arabinofuranosyltransferase